MGKIMIAYLDDNGNEVSEEEASRINIVEYDDNGKRIKETYMVSTKKTKEESLEDYDDVELDESMFSEMKWNLPNEDIFESEKTK